MPEIRPVVSVERARSLARELYGIEAEARELPSERDRNFELVTGDGGRFVLKIAARDERREVLELQDATLAHLRTHHRRGRWPRVHANREGATIVPIVSDDGAQHFARLLDWVPGIAMADARPHGPLLRRDLGAFLGSMRQALAGFEHPAAQRELKWHPGTGRTVVAARLGEIDDPAGRALVERTMLQFDRSAGPRLDRLPRGVIHNDANDHNVLVEGQCIRAVIDLGDVVHGWLVADLAVALAYALMADADPLGAGADVIAGYRELHPLGEDEFAALPGLVALRLCMSIAIAAEQCRRDPANRYLRVSQQDAWDLLSRLAAYTPEQFAVAWRSAGTALPASMAASGSLGSNETLRLRHRHVGPSLGLSYDRPLTIVRGFMQYLFDSDGRRYLDCVNNVAHVGHGHPAVVDAVSRQMAVLNTNTRYLHENLARYTARLTGLLPPPLEVCFLVSSGSEANDLALRLARAATGRHDLIVIDGAYHGNLTSLIEISPYKFAGPGGAGRPEHVHVVPMPDTYRGLYREHDPDSAARYAGHVARAIEEARGRPAAFIAEPLLGCGGQIVPPPGYLSEAFGLVREAGGLCIADEVQVGFGRVGRHFWGFETQGVVPDIVTLGKPIGNGHPLGAVITTRAIADAFANGMEYFNTFGGNPVSCAAGLAVLDAIEAEGLQARAERVGARVVAGFRDVAKRRVSIGDVRGLGLFLGIELVRDRTTRDPAPEAAHALVNQLRGGRLRDEGILLSTDGPARNVIKIKPPLVFGEDDADRLIAGVDTALAG